MVIYYILHRWPAHTIHWKFLHPVFQRQGGWTNCQVRHRASALLLPEYWCSHPVSSRWLLFLLPDSNHGRLHRQESVIPEAIRATTVIILLVFTFRSWLFQFFPKRTSSLKWANSGANDPSAFLPAVCTIFAMILYLRFIGRDAGVGRHPRYLLKLYFFQPVADLLSGYMMLGSKAPNNDANGLFRATHSHNPTRYSHIVVLTPHFYAHIGAGLKVILPPVCKHTWFQTFWPWHQKFLKN